MGSIMPKVGTPTGSPKSGLADSLFTATQQRVLAPLFGHPDQSFIQQELIERAGGGSGAIRRELARLVESGLVIMTHVGKQKHFQANQAAPIFQELRGIVLKTVALTDPLRSALRALAKRIELALVYGSVAGGKEHARSDIDLLIVSDELSLEAVFKRLAPVEKTLGRTIHPTLYTHADFLKRRRTANPFLTTVLAGEHIVLLGSLSHVDESR